MGFLDDLRGKSGKTGLLEKELLAPTDEGDHERFSHYVDKNKITESAVTGKPVLRGKSGGMRLGYRPGGGLVFHVASSPLTSTVSASGASRYHLDVRQHPVKDLQSRATFLTADLRDERTGDPTSTEP